MKKYDVLFLTLFSLSLNGMDKDSPVPTFRQRIQKIREQLESIPTNTVPLEDSMEKYPEEISSIVEEAKKSMEESEKELEEAVVQRLFIEKNGTNQEMIDFSISFNDLINDAEQKRIEYYNTLDGLHISYDKTKIINSLGKDSYTSDKDSLIILMNLLKIVNRH